MRLLRTVMYKVVPDVSQFWEYVFCGLSEGSIYISSAVIGLSFVQLSSCVV